MKISITGLDEEAEEGVGADVLITAPAITLQDAAPDFLHNPPRRQKLSTLPLHPDLGDLYQGASKLLVRTALVRDPTWDKGRRITVDGPYAIAELCRHLVHADQEHIVTLSMDNANQVLAIHEAAVGVTSGAMTTPAHLTKVALLSGASRIAMVHNHPSGNPKPSSEDEKMTRLAKETLECLGISFLDHVIVAYDGFYSFEAGGLRSWG